LAVGEPADPGAAGLYHQAIVVAARRACGHGHLASADACVQVDNPLCGDRVSMEVKVGDGRLRGIAHQVRGCLLCEAAASIIAENAVGGTAEDLTRVQDALCDALVNGFDERSLPWQALKVFAPVVHHRSRHRCVTLAFEALAGALAAVRTQTPPSD
jgi:nitrogen fixation NifU-like protein